MKTTYDLNCGAVYIKFKDKKVAYTEEATDTINVDYDASDRIIGIEILGGVSKEDFDTMTFEFLGGKDAKKSGQDT